MSGVCSLFSGVWPITMSYYLAHLEGGQLEELLAGCHDISQVSGWCLVGDWLLSARYLAGEWLLSARYPAGVWLVAGW